MSDKPRDCCIAECPNLVPASSEFGECAGCRARRRYWKRQRPAQWFKYRRKLTKFAARMDLLIGESKVTLLQKRKTS